MDFVTISQSTFEIEWSTHRRLIAEDTKLIKLHKGTDHVWSKWVYIDNVRIRQYLKSMATWQTVALLAFLSSLDVGELSTHSSHRHNSESLRHGISQACHNRYLHAYSPAEPLPVCSRENVVSDPKLSSQGLSRIFKESRGVEGNVSLGTVSSEDIRPSCSNLRDRRSYGGINGPKETQSWHSCVCIYCKETSFSGYIVISANSNKYHCIKTSQAWFDIHISATWSCLASDSMLVLCSWIKIILRDHGWSCPVDAIQHHMKRLPHMHMDLCKNVAMKKTSAGQVGTDRMSDSFEQNNGIP